MSGSANTRAHLVERAFKAMGGSSAVGLPNVALDATVAAPPATALNTADAVHREIQPDAAANPDAETSTALPLRDAVAGSREPQRPTTQANRVKPTPPSLEVMRQAGLVNAPDGGIRMRLAEEFSVIHHQVLRTIRTMEPPAEGSGRGRRTILVTSARPGEGKTFCSLNLAVSIAQGRSAPVLLVDADGKRGSLSELLGLGDAPGLRLLASDPAHSPTALLVPTELKNLSVLPYGAIVPGVPAVPPGTTIAAAIQRLSAMLPQHVIVLDAPPCLSTSDPSSLAPIAGQVLLVVEAERTQAAEIEAALDMVEACPVLQLMLNKSQMNSTDTFGSYGAYGAYGGYSVYGGHGPKSEAAG